MVSESASWHRAAAAAGSAVDESLGRGGADRAQDTDQAMITVKTPIGRDSRQRGVGWEERGGNQADRRANWLGQDLDAGCRL